MRETGEGGRGGVGVEERVVVWSGLGWDGVGGFVEGSGNNNKKCEIKDPTLVAK